MATHSSIFAWRSPWAEEPGRLQSMGLQRATNMYIYRASCIYIYIFNYGMDLTEAEDIKKRWQ